MPEKVNNITTQGIEQNRQGRQQTVQGIDLTDIKVSIARIEENVKSIKVDVGEIKDSTDGLSKDVVTTGNRITKVEERLSIFAIFASIFSIITGAIATYLGTKR